MVKAGKRHNNYNCYPIRGWLLVRKLERAMLKKAGHDFYEALGLV